MTGRKRRSKAQKMQLRKATEIALKKRSKIGQLSCRLEEREEDVKEIQAEMQTLRQELKVLEEEMQKAQEDVEGMKHELSTALLEQTAAKALEGSDKDLKLCDLESSSAPVSERYCGYPPPLCTAM